MTSRMAPWGIQNATLKLCPSLLVDFGKLAKAVYRYLCMNKTERKNQATSFASDLGPLCPKMVLPTRTS